MMEKCHEFSDKAGQLQRLQDFSCYHYAYATTEFGIACSGSTSASYALADSWALSMQLPNERTEQGEDELHSP